MPSDPIRKPDTQNTIEAAMAARGPLRSTQVPNSAADRPSITIAIEKMMPMGVFPVSKCSISAFL